MRGKMRFRTPLVLEGQCGTQVMASYPLKPHDLHLCWLKGLSPALMVWKLGCVPGACASDGWCSCIWLSLVVYSTVYVPNQVVVFFLFLQAGGVARCELLLSCPAIQTSSFYFTSKCMESTQIVVILDSLKLCSSSKCHSKR